MIEQPDQVVLVQDDVVFGAERARVNNTALAFLARAAGAAPPSQPFMALQPPKPQWSLFEDKFVSVVPVTEAYSQQSIGAGSRSQPVIIFQFRSPRPDDPEPEFVRANHNALLFMPRRAIAYLEGFVIEIPDLNDHPWLEWVHPPPTPETQLFPFRQIYRTPPTVPLTISAYKPPFQYVDAEPDSRPPVNHGLLLYPFRILPTIQPPPPTIRVQAMAAGTFGGIYRDIGDVFDIPLTALSDFTVSFAPPGNPDYPVYGWMLSVPKNTPLFTWALSGNSSPRNNVRRWAL